MRKLIAIPFLVLVIYFLFFCEHNAYSGVRRTGPQILSLGGGARANALGETFITTSGDVMNTVSNPAGLALMKEIQFQGSYTDYSKWGEAWEGVYYSILAASSPIDFGDFSLGVGGIALQMEGQGVIEVTTDSPEVVRYEDLGTDWVTTISYAKTYNPILFGISGKIIHQELTDEYMSNTYAYDIGIQIPIIFSTLDKYTLGIAVRNDGPGVQFKDEQQPIPLPRQLEFGISTDLVHPTKMLRIHGAAELYAAIDKLKDEKTEGQIEFMEGE